MITEEQRLHELRTLKDVYAKAKSESVYLDHFRKSKLAILMKEFIVDYKTAAAQEREARAHPAYLELLDGLRVAVEIEAKAFWELKIAMAGIEIWRSKRATERAEMGMR